MFCLKKVSKASKNQKILASNSINSLDDVLADNNASFLRAARAGNVEKVLDYLKANIDINISNANGLNALHLASKEGHVHVVTELLRKGANVNAATKKGNTALHIASLAGQDEVVKILVNLGANVNAQSQNGFTPLYMAAQENHDAVVSFLLANGANQSLETEDGFTPLAVALQQGHDKVVAVLLENDTKGRVRLPALHIAAKKDDCKAATLLLQNDHNPDVTSKSGFTPLHIAAHYGNEKIAHILLEKGADVNYSAKHQITPLHVASKWGKSNMVSLLLSKGAKIEAATRDGLTPLHCAARSGHDQVVDFLLEKSAPILAKTKNGLAPLHMASQGDHVDSARTLLCHKAPIDDITVDYLTALHVAAHCGHVKVAKLLLDRKADPNARALNGFTPLHIACKKNRIKIVELLLKHGASIEATTESGLSPLHVASFMGCMNIVIHLIQSGANPDVPTVRGETPLHLAVRANQIDIIRILLRNGANVDARAREEQTPLHIAARLGNVDIVSLLLQHGAAVDATTKDMYTALHIASKEGQEEVVAVLLDHEASLTSSTKRGFTPLHLAAKYGNIMVIRLLLQKDAPVDAQGKNGLTPLHVAAHYNHVNEALLLLEKGASPHATAKNGYTPLHIAAKKNQMEIVTTLFEYGAKCNAESKAGYTPLHLSSQEGHTDMSTLLIEHQADVNRKANNGLTPLHLCAQEDRVNVASVLVKNNAKIGPQTNAGYTPLHVASHFGQINMIRFLLQNNADVHMTTEHGYTALHQAAQQGHTPVVNLLLENKASPNVFTSQGQTALSIAQRLGYISVVETLKVVTETTVTTTTTTVTEEKYKVVSPEIMQETFLTDSEDEGGEDTMLGDQSYRYLTADEMKSLGDDSLPIDVTKDEKQNETMHIKDSTAPMVEEDKLSPQHITPVETGFIDKLSPDNIDISKAPVHAGFLVSFMVDARGGAMRGCRHSGVRVIIPPRKASMPMRITCRYLRKEKLVHPPPLMEGEACASRILEVGPVGARFLGPVIIEVPHFASLRGREREVTILRSDTGETWREHALEASEEAVQDVLNESFEGDELSALEDLNTNRITRILTTDFPQYFAIITRIRQEVQGVGPEGGMVSSTVVPQVQAIFPEGALQKKIRVGLQAQPIASDLVTKLLGNRVAVSPIVTVEPRRRKFHKPITLTIPVPQAATKGMINQYSGDAPTLRLLCSITGGSSKAQWEDVTGSTPLTFVNDCVSFTTTVSAKFWLMDCRQVNEVSRFAMELYQEAAHVPFMAKFVIFAKRNDPTEAQIRVFCMTDDKEDKTLETQEHFTEIAKSRDVEVLEGKLQYLEFAGNLVPVANSGEQLKFAFQAFHENRLPFRIRVKDPNIEPMGRIAFMREQKVNRGEPSQSPICNLNIAMPKVFLNELTPAALELVTLEKKYDFMQESGLSKPESIHRANLRLSDIARELDKDWIVLANELHVPESDIAVAKSEFPDDVGEQALSMLRLWLQKTGSRATGNELEKGLRKINRSDIIKKCMFNVELVTDDVEKAVAKVHLDQSGFDVFKEELGSSREASVRRGGSQDASYDEQDIMKEAESAAETSSETGSLFEKDQVSRGHSEEREVLRFPEEVLKTPMNDLSIPDHATPVSEELSNVSTVPMDTGLQGNDTFKVQSNEIPHVIETSQKSDEEVLFNDTSVVTDLRNVGQPNMDVQELDILRNSEIPLKKDVFNNKLPESKDEKLLIDANEACLEQTGYLETDILLNFPYGELEDKTKNDLQDVEENACHFQNIESATEKAHSENESIEGEVNSNAVKPLKSTSVSEVEAKQSRVSKTPPPSPAEGINANFLTEELKKDQIGLAQAEITFKETPVRSPENIGAGSDLAPKVVTESETWPSAELDTSQVSISSLPDDERSEPTTATVSSTMDGDKIQDIKEWTEIDESGQVNHVVLKTSHMILRKEEKPDDASQKEGVELGNGGEVALSSSIPDTEYVRDCNQIIQSVEEPMECLEIKEHTEHATPSSLQSYMVTNETIEVTGKCQLFREINDECLEVSGPTEDTSSIQATEFLNSSEVLVKGSVDCNEVSPKSTGDVEVSLKPEQECVTLITEEYCNLSEDKPKETESLTSDHAEDEKRTESRRNELCSGYALVEQSSPDICEEHPKETSRLSKTEILTQTSEDHGTAFSANRSSEGFMPLAFDNTAFVGADLIDACEDSVTFRSRSPYEVVRDEPESTSFHQYVKVTPEADQIDFQKIDRPLSTRMLEERRSLQQYSSVEEIKVGARRKPILQHIPSEISEEDLVETELSPSSSEYELPMPEVEEQDTSLLSKPVARITISSDEEKKKESVPTENILQSTTEMTSTQFSSEECSQEPSCLINVAFRRSTESITSPETDTGIAASPPEFLSETETNDIQKLIEPDDSKSMTEPIKFHDSCLSSTSTITQTFDEKSITQNLSTISDDDTLQLTHGGAKRELNVTETSSYVKDSYYLDGSNKIDFDAQGSIRSPAEQQMITEIAYECLGAVGGRSTDEIITRTSFFDDISPEKHYSSISDDAVDAEIGEILGSDQLEDDIIERPQTPEPPIDENVNGPKRQSKMSTVSSTQGKELCVDKLYRSEMCKTLPTVREREIHSDEEYDIIDESELGIMEQDGADGFIESEKVGLRKMGSFKDITTVHLSHTLDEGLTSDIDSKITCSGLMHSEESEGFVYGMQFEKDLEDQSEEAMDIDSDQYSEEKEVAYSYGMRFERDHELEEDDIPCYGDLYTHHEEDEEVIEEMDKPKQAIATKSAFDILSGRKCFAKGGEVDDLSVNSLQEFERLEEEIRSGRRSSIGSIDSLNGKYHHSKSGEHDDVSMNSLTEFEKLERECSESEKLEVTVDTCTRLAEIEEGHESQTSEASQETLSDAGKDDECEDFDSKLDILGTMLEQVHETTDNGRLHLQYSELMENHRDENTLREEKSPTIASFITKSKSDLEHNFETEKNGFDNINFNREKQITLVGHATLSDKFNKVTHDDQALGYPYIKEDQIDVVCTTLGTKDSKSDDVEQDSLHEDRSKLESLSGDDKCEYHDSLREDKSGDLDSLHDIQDVMRDSLHEEKAVEDDSLHEMDILPDESSLSLESSLAAIIDVDSLSEKIDIQQIASEQDFDTDSLKEINLANVLETVFTTQNYDVTVVETSRCKDNMLSSTDSLEASSSAGTRATYQLENESLLSSSLNSVQTSEDYTMVSIADVLEPEVSSEMYDSARTVETRVNGKNGVFIDYEGNLQEQDFDTKMKIEKELSSIIKLRDDGELSGPDSVEVRSCPSIIKYNGERQAFSESHQFQYAGNTETGTEDEFKFDSSEQFEPEVEVEEINTVDEKGNPKKIRRIKRVVRTTRTYTSTSSPTHVEKKFHEYLLQHGTDEETGKTEEEIKDERSLDEKGNVVIVRSVQQHVISDPVVHCRTFTGPNAQKSSDDFVDGFRKLEATSDVKEYENVDEDGNIVRITQQVRMEPAVRTVSFSGPNARIQMEDFMKEFQGTSSTTSAGNSMGHSSQLILKEGEELSVSQEEAVLEPDVDTLYTDTHVIKKSRDSSKE